MTAKLSEVLRQATVPPAAAATLRLEAEGEGLRVEVSGPSMKEASSFRFAAQELDEAQAKAVLEAAGRASEGRSLKQAPIALVTAPNVQMTAFRALFAAFAKSHNEVWLVIDERPGE